MKTALAFLLLSSAYAYCPESCSGHGSCGAHDSCVCYRNWQGVSCSERTCPFGISWTDVESRADGTFHHKYTECSSKGSCDRKTGQCDCVEGFQGKGCKRMSCNDDCSGHGTCERISGVANPSDATSTYKGFATTWNDHIWDSDKIQYCVCDPGWTGDSCGSRKCKPGNDPLTEWATADQQAQVQTIGVWSADPGAGNAITVAGQFTLTYTDWRGEKWETWPITAATFTATTIKEALKGLPNSAIPDVTVGAVTAVGTAGSGDLARQFTVTFSSPDTSGNQPLLEANYGGCATAGCQPYYAALSEVQTSVATTAHGGASTSTPFVYVTQTTAADTEYAECSNRGTCDSETGLCSCFTGYYGESCDAQTIIA